MIGGMAPGAREVVKAQFGSLCEADCDTLMESLEFRCYADGDLLARQGEDGEEAYLILEGQVDVHLERDGTRRLLGTPQAGEIVGEMAVLEQRPRVADIRAKGPVKVLVFDRGRFLKLLAGRPELGMTLIKILSVRMRSTLDQYMEDMLEKIQELEVANGHLADLNGKLEQKVAERTQKLEEANAVLTELASKDYLTRAYSRRFFIEKLEALCQSPDLTFTLLIVDIDHFKKYNDAHGHLAGDQLLKEFCQVLNGALREDDVLGRYGGEEFLVLLPGLGRKEGVMVAERLRKTVAEHPFAHRESQPLGTISMSGGLAWYPSEAQDARSLLEIADKRLYASKESGRNRIQGSSLESQSDP